MTIKTIIYSSCSAVPFKMFARLLQASQPAGEIFSVWCCWWWSVRRLRCLHQHYCELAGATPGTPGGRSLPPPWPNTPCSSSSSQTSPWSPPPPWGLLCWHNVKQSYSVLLSYLRSSVRSVLLPTTTIGTLKFHSPLCNPKITLIHLSPNLLFLHTISLSLGSARNDDSSPTEKTKKKILFSIYILYLEGRILEYVSLE